MERAVLKKIKIFIYIFALNIIEVNAGNRGECYESQKEERQEYFLTTYEALISKVPEGERITPDAGPVVEGGVDMYVELDYIFWHVDEGGLAYAQQSTPAAGLPVTSNNTLIPGVVLRPSFKFSSGFKSGIGFDFDYDGWCLGATYTWIFSKATSAFDDPETLTLWEGNFSVLPVNQRDDLIVFQTSAQNGNAEWSLHFNTIDLDLGRSFFVSPHLILRPHFGLKGSWMKQLFDIFYSGQGISALISATDFKKTSYVFAEEGYQIRNKQYVWSLGPRVGLDTNWMFTKNMSCFAELSISGLWGQFTENRIDRSDVVDLVSNAQVLKNFTSLNNTDTISQINPVIEMQVGFRYDYWFYDSQYRVRLQAGWEAQTWFDQNHFIKQGTSGNLNLQGLTINFRFDF